MIFWDKVKNMHNFLKPITYRITKIENYDPQLSVISEIIVEIMEKYKNCIKNISCLQYEKKKKN